MAKEYASDEDPLDNDELETASTSSSSASDLITSREDYAEMVDEFMDRYELLGRKLKPVLAGGSAADKLETLRRELGQDERVRVIAVEAADEDELDDDELFRGYDANEKEDRWDCETILSKRTEWLGMIYSTDLSDVLESGKPSTHNPSTNVGACTEGQARFTHRVTQCRERRGSGDVGGRNNEARYVSQGVAVERCLLSLLPSCQANHRASSG